MMKKVIRNFSVLISTLSVFVSSPVHASILFDGVNDGMTGTFTSTYADPITIGIKVKYTAHPVAVDVMASLGNGDTRDDSYMCRTNATDDQFGALSRSSGGGEANANVVKAGLDGVWFSIVCEFPSGDSDRNVFVEDVTDTNGGDEFVGGALQFLRAGQSLSEAQEFAGRLAEFAIWDRVLTTQEITDYIDDDCTASIGSSDLIGYWSFNVNNATQPNEGVDAGGDLTAMDSAVFDSDHPVMGSCGSGAVQRIMRLFEGFRLTIGSGKLIIMQQ